MIVDSVFSEIELGQTLNLNVDKMVFRTLIDGIYTNKFRSVLREVCTNARDSHIAAGNLEPYDLKFYQNSLEAIYKIVLEDRGTGLSKDEAINLLCSLNSSSKRSDASAIGFFGIGAKSPFAISNEFIYICRKDGQETKIEFVRALDGSPQFNVLGVKHTEEPDGVILTIHLKEPEQSSDDALKTLLRNTFTFFSVKPRVSLVLHTGTEIPVEDPWPMVKEYEDGYLIENPRGQYTTFCKRSTIVIDELIMSFSSCQSSYARDRIMDFSWLPKFSYNQLSFGEGREVIENTQANREFYNDYITEAYKNLKDKFEAKRVAGTLDLDFLAYYESVRSMWSSYMTISDTEFLVAVVKLKHQAGHPDPMRGVFPMLSRGFHPVEMPPEDIPIYVNSNFSWDERGIDILPYRLLAITGQKEVFTRIAAEGVPHIYPTFSHLRKELPEVANKLKPPKTKPASQMSSEDDGTYLPAKIRNVFKWFYFGNIALTFEGTYRQFMDKLKPNCDTYQGIGLVPKEIIPNLEAAEAFREAAKAWRDTSNIYASSRMILEVENPETFARLKAYLSDRTFSGIIVWDEEFIRKIPQLHIAYAARSFTDEELEIFAKHRLIDPFTNPKMKFIATLLYRHMDQDKLQEILDKSSASTCYIDYQAYFEDYRRSIADEH